MEIQELKALIKESVREVLPNIAKSPCLQVWGWIAVSRRRTVMLSECVCGKITP